MTDAQTALSRRVVACKGFRWLPGMLTDEGLRVVTVNEEHRYLHVHPGSLLLPTQGYTLPDLTDPATVGCILALVREAWGQPEMCCWRSIAPGLGVYLALVREAWGQDEAFCYRERWCVETPQGGYVYGASEAEALVAALESAP